MEPPQLHDDKNGRRRLDHEDALAEAQRLGYAESDPTNDVEESRDVAYKMVHLEPQFCLWDE